MLEFPGSVDGPWARYIDPDTVNPLPEKTLTPALSQRERGIGTVRYPRLVPRDEECAKELKKRTLTNLYNQRPTWLDLAHRKLDEVVLDAYGWPHNLTDEEILSRLLALNLQRSTPSRESTNTDEDR